VRRGGVVARAFLVVVAVIALAPAARAQTAEAYVVRGGGTERYVGAPTTDYASVAAGGELLLAGRVGGVLDVDWVSFSATSISVGGVVHFQVHQGQRIVPLLMAGRAQTTGDRRGHGPVVSAGAIAWLSRRVGLRGEYYYRSQRLDLPASGGRRTEVYRVTRIGVVLRW
jgi:hypothetical protein